MTRQRVRYEIQHRSLPSRPSNPHERANAITDTYRNTTNKKPHALHQQHQHQHPLQTLLSQETEKPTSRTDSIAIQKMQKRKTTKNKQKQPNTLARSYSQVQSSPNRDRLEAIRRRACHRPSGPPPSSDSMTARPYQTGIDASITPPPTPSFSP